MAEDIANPEFSVVNLAVLIPASPANDHDASVNNEGETTPSASDGVESSSAVAPVTVDPLLHEDSIESTVPTAASETQATAESSEISALESETLDPEFSLAKPNVLGLSAPVDNNDAVVNCEGDASLSANDETRTSSTVAPATHTPRFYETSGQPTIQATLSDERTAAEPSEINYLLQSDPNRSCSRCRGSWASSTSSISPFEYEHFLAPSPTEEVGMTSSAENGESDLNPEEDEGKTSEKRSYDPVPQCMSITRANNDSLTSSCAIIPQERTSAEDEAKPSSSVAPTQPPAVLCRQPVRPVIRITPPSPTNTIQPSQSNLLAQRTAMNRYNSARPPYYRRVPHSPASSDGPGLVRQADRLAVPSFQRSRSRRFKTAESSQPEDVMTGLNRRDFNHPVSLAERTPERHTTPVGIQRLSKSGSPRPSAETLQSFDYPGDSVNQPGVKLSAAGEGEPSSIVAPSRSPAVLRKPRKVKAVPARLAPAPVLRQARPLVSRIASSLGQWGNTVSRFFTFRRSTKVEEAETFHPSFDPWQGFVPSPEASPETTADDDPAPLESNIWNIYVKLD
ncbi:hypothetical protein FRC01_009652 [Tulasnella sp. 417]|nr:hypothetical protein FRC01_009652 [Tulasnella sp. 417]